MPALMRNTALATAGVLVQGVARFAYTVLIGRFLGAEELGRVSALIALALFVTLLWPTASGVAASRFLAHEAGSGVVSLSTRALNAQFLLALLPLSGVTFVVAWLVGGSGWSAAGAVVLMVTLSAYAYTRGASLGTGRVVGILVWDLVSAAAALTLLVVVLVAGASWYLLVPLAFGYAIFAGAHWPRSRSGPDRSRPSAIARFVAVNSIAQVATGGLLQWAMVSAQISDTPRQAGLFAAAFAVATPASMLGLSINQVLIPHFSRARGADAGIPLATTARIVAASAAVLLMVFGIVALVGPMVLAILFGSAFGGAAGYLLALLIGVYLYSVSLVIAAPLVASERHASYAAVAAAGFLVGVAWMAFAAPALGAWASVLGYGAAQMVTLVLLILAMARVVRRGRSA